MVTFKNIFGNSQQSEIMTTALDLARAAASYASNQDDIAPYTRSIHEVEAQSTSLLTAEDEAILFEIYLKIEQYLVTSDPIRKFNKDELRSKASNGLRARLEAFESRHFTKKQPVLTPVG